jgi:hypothetical protein
MGGLNHRVDSVSSEGLHGVLQGATQDRYRIVGIQLFTRLTNSGSSPLIADCREGNDFLRVSSNHRNLRNSPFPLKRIRNPFMSSIKIACGLNAWACCPTASLFRWRGICMPFFDSPTGLGDYGVCTAEGIRVLQMCKQRDTTLDCRDPQQVCLAVGPSS